MPKTQPRMRLWTVGGIVPDKSIITIDRIPYGDDWGDIGIGSAGTADLIWHDGYLWSTGRILDAGGVPLYTESYVLRMGPGPTNTIYGPLNDTTTRFGGETGCLASDGTHLWVAFVEDSNVPDPNPAFFTFPQITVKEYAGGAWATIGTIFPKTMVTRTGGFVGLSGNVYICASQEEPGVMYLVWGEQGRDPDDIDGTYITRLVVAKFNATAKLYETDALYFESPTFSGGSPTGPLPSYVTNWFWGDIRNEDGSPVLFFSQSVDLPDSETYQPSFSFFKPLVSMYSVDAGNGTLTLLHTLTNSDLPPEDAAFSNCVGASVSKNKWRDPDLDKDVYMIATSWGNDPDNSDGIFMHRMPCDGSETFSFLDGSRRSSVVAGTNSYIVGSWADDEGVWAVSRGILLYERQCDTWGWYLPRVWFGPNPDDNWARKIIKNPDDPDNLYYIGRLGLELWQGYQLPINYQGDLCGTYGFSVTQSTILQIFTGSPFHLTTVGTWRVTFSVNVLPDYVEFYVDHSLISTADSPVGFLYYWNDTSPGTFNFGALGLGGHLMTVKAYWNVSNLVKENHQFITVLP